MINKIKFFLKKEKKTIIIIIILGTIIFNLNKIIDFKANSQKHYKVNFLFSAMKDETVRANEKTKAELFCSELTSKVAKIKNQCDIYEVKQEEINDYIKVLAYSDLIFIFDQVNQTNIQLNNVGKNSYLYKIEIQYNYSWQSFIDFTEVTNEKIKL